jgi:mannose-6-phosphate isomerase-like protein (cupin superfamily)
MLETIVHEDKTLAIVLRAGYHEEGIRFFTPDEFSQQLAYMNRPAGYVIPPHVHNPVRREVQYTNEVLFIKSGRVRVDFYSDRQRYLESTVLERGDVILLVVGGHGFEMLEASEIVEVKQGPYAGEADKTRFAGIDAAQVKWKS